MVMTDIDTGLSEVLFAELERCFREGVVLHRREPDRDELLNIAIRDQSGDHLGLLWFNLKQLRFGMVNHPYPLAFVDMIDYSFNRLREAVKQTFPKHCR